jgi:nucleotide-binding universal stress UspA family protein
LTVHPGDIQKHRRIRRILVPTDFSHDAEDAIHTALALLRDLDKGAHLILLHVYHLPIEYTAYGTIPTSVHYLEDAGAAAEARLDETAASLAREGLMVEPVARQGYPPEVIVEEAEERQVDLIAMGTHGRSGLAHLLLGSTAERVVQRAPCPVLTVRRPDAA